MFVRIVDNSCHGSGFELTPFRILSGAAVTWQIGSWINVDPSLPTHHGAAIFAIDPCVMTPATTFVRRIQSLIDEIHAARQPAAWSGF
jgi:LDH2 family malate/lactate/ureidoglycolate dehydrogenase